MKTLVLRHDFGKAAAKLKAQHAATSHSDHTIDRDTVVIAPDGRITAVLITQQIAAALCDRAYQDWRTIKELPSNRATAIGVASLPRQRNDGTLSERKGVHKRVLDALQKQGMGQGVLGFLDATPDQPCHRTPLSAKHPEMLDRHEQLIREVDALYAKHVPSLYAIQRAHVEKAPRFRLWDTAFTTIYVVKNLRSAYHADRGNLRGVMSALMPMGKFTGGALILARWRLAVALKPGDLLLFDPQQLHGNLPFEGERLSAIFYSERRIADCDK